MTSGCLDRKEVRGAIWGVHSTTDRPAGGNTGRLFLAFGGPVCADRISNCPLDRVLTYKNLIYLLNLQFSCVVNIHVVTQMIHSFPQNTCSLSSVNLEGWLLAIKLNVFKRPTRDACLCMGELQAPPAPAAPPAPPAPHFVFLITL